MAAMKYVATLILAVVVSSVALGDDSYHAYRDTGFKGKDAIVRPVTGQLASRIHPMPEAVKRKMSSVKWNLPRGVVVVITDDQSGLGRQLPLWGIGEMTSLANTDIDERCESWYWAYVDGWDEAPTSVRSAYSARPIGATKSPAIADQNTLSLYKDIAVRNKGDKVQQITSVTDVPEGELQAITTELNNRVSSMRWNLPPGIIVVLYDIEDGTGRREVIWGNGDQLKMGPMNDRASAWAWYNIAAPRSE
jgi:hypothetical protein